MVTVRMTNGIAIRRLCAAAESDIAGLTVPINRSAEMVAMHGGITFHIIMFSTVNTAFDVAVTRLVSMPGSRSVK